MLGHAKSDHYHNINQHCTEGSRFFRKTKRRFKDLKRTSKLYFKMIQLGNPKEYSEQLLENVTSAKSLHVRLKTPK